MVNKGKDSKAKEPVRVCHIIGNYIGGGVEAVVMNYYRYIDRTKIQFDFVCSDVSTQIPYDEIEKLGGRVYIVPHYARLREFSKALTEIFKKNNYKIVHSHINTLSIFPLRIAKKCGVPIRIAHSHSTTNRRERKKDLLKQILRPFSKVYATDYFCCSEYAGRWLFSNRTYKRGKVYLLNNAIDIDKFKFDQSVRNKKRKELGIADNITVVGHIGRFVPQKNHEFLINCFSEFTFENPDSVLLLAGEGELLEDMKEKVKKMKLEDYVKFLGHRDDVDELYNVFDMFLMPSLYEGLPVTSIEAQATGLPCILSDEITKEAKIDDRTIFVKLNLSALDWSKYMGNMVQKLNCNRTDNLKKISERGFDLKKEATKLQKKYLESIHNTNS